MTLKNFYLKRINFEQIKPIWNILWKDRKQEPFSSMTMKGDFDSKIKDIYKFSAFGVYESGKLIGVNAGHKSAQLEYRTRGLWVAQDYRGNGVAQMLFTKLEEQAKAEGARWLWSFPRLSSLPAYMRAGYKSYGDPEKAEFEQNVRAKKDLSIVTTVTFREGQLDKTFDNEIEILERQHKLLGQNTEIRNGINHVTQHWCNDHYIMWKSDKKVLPKPATIIIGDLDNPNHVL